MSTQHLMQFFAYAHLPPHLQAASKPFATAAETLDLRPLAEHLATLPNNEQRLVAMRKINQAAEILQPHARALPFFEQVNVREALQLLIEAKDCAVRALVYKEPEAKT